MLDFVATSIPFEGNPTDVNKLGALPVKSETVQNGNVKLSSSEVPDTNVHPAVYNSWADPMATGSSAPILQSSPPQVGPPAAHTVPQDPSSTPDASVPPSKPAQVVHAESSPPSEPVHHAESTPPPAPNSTPLPPNTTTPPNTAPPPPSTAPQPKVGPPPPPPKSSGAPGPPPPALPSSKMRPPPPMNKLGNKVDDGAGSQEAKTKLKPFFWDKVTANANQSMVWDHLKSGSFQ